MPTLRIPEWLKTPVGVVGATLAAILLLALVSPLWAADKGGPQIPALVDNGPATAKTWTGFYLGAGVNMTAGVMDPIFGVDGYGYDGRAGYDQQMGRILAGVFADYGKKHITAFGSTIDAKEWSYGARAGVLATDTTLIYGLVSRPTLDVMGSDTVGIGVGGGIETMLNKSFSASLEYQRHTYDDIPDGREHVVRFGINWRPPANLFSGTK